jgi:hypothetical protein
MIIFSAMLPMKSEMGFAELLRVARVSNFQSSAAVSNVDSL